MRPLARSTTSAGLSAALLLAASAALCPGGNRAVAPATALSPGSVLLIPVPLDASRDSFLVWRLRPGRDSVAAVAAGMGVDVAVGSDDSTVEVVTSWGPPVSSLDSLILDRPTLAPREEALASPGLRFRYRYEGRRASGSLQRGDSGPREITREFHEPIFAFNELELIVRSLRYAAGRSVIVPLFSETDADLERDTITVVGDTALANGRGAWIVRFADPAVVQRYIVDSTSRHAVRITTRQRRSGALFEARPP
jgi:hypothetical protein